MCYVPNNILGLNSLHINEIVSTPGSDLRVESIVPASSFVISGTDGEQVFTNSLDVTGESKGFSFEGSIDKSELSTIPYDFLNISPTYTNTDSAGDIINILNIDTTNYENSVLDVADSSAIKVDTIDMSILKTGTQEIIASNGDIHSMNITRRNLNGFFSWGGSGNYWSSSGTTFTLLRPGIVYVNAMEVQFTAPQSVTMIPHVNNHIYIDSDGLLVLTTDHTDSHTLGSALFCCYYNGSLNFVTKENHFYNDNLSGAYISWNIRILGTTIFPTTSCNLTAVNTTADGTTQDQMQLSIASTGLIDDINLFTQINDTAGSPIDIMVYYLDASGHWIQYSNSAYLPPYWNDGGTPTRLNNSGTANRCIYKIYAAKDNLNSTDPQFIAIMDNIQQNRVATNTRIADGLYQDIDAVLANCELSSLGLCIVRGTSTYGYVQDIILQKGSVGNNTNTQVNSSGLASLTITDTSTFTQNLSASDTNVQAALETLDLLSTTFGDNIVTIGASNCDYTTITLALAGTTPDNSTTYLLFPGTYTETVNMVDDFHLVGIDKNTCIIQGSCFWSSITSASNSSLENLTIKFTGTSSALNLDENDNIRISNCIIDNNLQIITDAMIQIDSVTNCTVESCEIRCSSTSTSLGDYVIALNCPSGNDFSAKLKNNVFYIDTKSDIGLFGVESDVESNSKPQLIFSDSLVDIHYQSGVVTTSNPIILDIDSLSYFRPIFSHNVFKISSESTITNTIDLVFCYGSSSNSEFLSFSHNNWVLSELLFSDSIQVVQMDSSNQQFSIINDSFDLTIDTLTFSHSNSYYSINVQCTDGSICYNNHLDGVPMMRLSKMENVSLDSGSFYSINATYDSAWKTIEDSYGWSLKIDQGSGFLECRQNETSGSSQTLNTTFKISKQGYPYFPYMNTGIGSNPVYIDSNGQLLENTSSVRYKQNIIDVDIDTDYVSDLRFRSYTRKNDQYNQIEYGLISEEVEVLEPKASTYKQTLDPETNEITSIIPHGINFNYLLFTSLKCIQEMREEITELKNRITQLEN